MATLDELVNVLYCDGVPMPGSDMSDDEALVYAKQYYPQGNYCLVRDWRWLDLEVTEDQRLLLLTTQRQPALIYAHTVIYDSERRWDVGDFVRTSLLHKHEGFHFRTLNSIYLLLGQGRRLKASAETVASIF